MICVLNLEDRAKTRLKRRIFASKIWDEIWFAKAGLQGTSSVILCSKKFICVGPVIEAHSGTCRSCSVIQNSSGCNRQLAPSCYSETFNRVIRVLQPAGHAPSIPYRVQVWIQSAVGPRRCSIFHACSPSRFPTSARSQPD
jgi:hypothetical protein